MTVRELREKYLKFFESKGHSLHASGSLVPYDVTGRLDESLLFNGAGMVQFKPYFRGSATPPNRRLATCQKCLRTGDIESVGDSSHLTFFEMLGNFSFGDYFKQEAIAFSWEFLTSAQWLGLDPRKLSFTVFEDDDEAFGAWSVFLTAADLNPNHRVFRLGEDTNYWPAGSRTNGPPGPCGPNSEMFYWTAGEPPTGPYSREDWLRDEADGKWLEIWNDVFISFEWQGVQDGDSGWTKTGMPDLPFKSIDTGMGLERTSAVLRGLSSVYDTDAFQPILHALGSVAGHEYGSDERKDTAMRIIADHLRAGVFCITDGILPSNTGRGYVLRRLLRRAILKGSRTLGLADPFMASLSTSVIEAMGSHYLELRDRQELIAKTLEAEELQFRRTLAEGVSVLTSILEQVIAGELDGDQAFFLYDTFGFPLEVTEEICAEAGIDVDLIGYRAAMEQAQERSRGAGGMDTVYGGVEGSALQAPPTEFLGYFATESAVKVAAALAEGDHAVVALDQTPFYAESGGQVADHGVIEGNGFRLEVSEVKKKDGVWLHRGRLSGEVLPGASAAARVDAGRRRHVVRNHTATHLMHAALRQTLGGHVAQAGSLVAPDELRFDFTHGQAMTSDELAEVERIVNEQIMLADPVRTYEDVPLADARAMGAMALFGEKYADRVRVVQIGGMDPGEPSFSRELCGGIHVANTGQIGLFKIVHESSAAGGVRRIQAVTGAGALEWVRSAEESIHQAAARLKSNPKELLAAIDKLQEQVREERRKREKLASQGAAASAAESHDLGGAILHIVRLTDVDSSDAERTADRLADSGGASVALIALVAGGKLSFVVKASEAAVKAGIHAGNLARDVAKATGGGGGGRPNFATAGGRDLGQLDSALASAPSIAAAMVKS